MTFATRSFPRSVGPRLRDKVVGRKVWCRVRFRPCIDLHDGAVKQIVGSTLKDMGDDDEGSEPVTNFQAEESAAQFARMYQSASLPGGHVILLDKKDATREAAKSALAAYPGGLQVGGGVTADTAKGWIDSGASHVIVTSFAFQNGELDDERLQSLVAKVGKERLVLDLSCRYQDGLYWVVTDRWQRFSSLALIPETLQDLSKMCDEFLVHGVDVEGMRLGVDERLIETLAAAVDIPVTYAGGVRNMEDLALVERAGKGKLDVTVGSSLDCFGGDLKFDDVVEWHRARNS